MNTARVLAVVAAAALLVAACTSSSATSTPTTLQPTIAPPTQTPTMPALPSGPLASFALPSFDLHADPALEATLPDTIGGQQVQKLSLSLAQLQALSGQTSDTNKAFMNWIQSLGKNPSDVNVAVGNTSGTPKISIVAIKVNGANSAQMLTGFQQAVQQQNIAATQTTVGGKSVLQVTDPTQTGTVSYVYAKNDVLFVAQSTDSAGAQSAVQALP